MSEEAKQSFSDHTVQLEAEENKEETPKPEDPTSPLVEFIKSLPSSQQDYVRFTCMGLEHVPLAKKLEHLEKYLTEEQLTTCQRLLEEQSSNFKKFLPKNQHDLVDELLLMGDFSSVRDIVAWITIPAANDAFENYLKHNRIEIAAKGPSEAVERGNNDKKCNEKEVESLGSALTQNEDQREERKYGVENCISTNIVKADILQSYGNNSAPKSNDEDLKEEEETTQVALLLTSNGDYETVVTTSESIGKSEEENEAGDTTVLLKKDEDIPTLQLENFGVVHVATRELIVYRKTATGTCFPFLDGETPELINCVYSTIKDKNLPAKQKDQQITYSLSDENQERYGDFKDQLKLTVISQGFSKYKLKLLKKLLREESPDVKRNGFQWYSKLSEEDQTLEVIMARIRRMLRSFVKEKTSVNRGADLQIVLYTGNTGNNGRTEEKRGNFFAKLLRMLKKGMDLFLRVPRRLMIKKPRYKKIASGPSNQMVKTWTGRKKAERVRQKMAHTFMEQFGCCMKPRTDE